MSALQQRLDAPLIDDEFGDARRRALKALMTHGFPDLKTEAWKYTSLRQLDKRAAGEASSCADPARDDLALPFDAALIELRPDAQMPEGIRLELLSADDLKDVAYGGREDAFAWLNLARMTQPWRLRIDKTLERPIVLKQASGKGFTGDQHTYLHIEVAEGADATLLDWQHDEGAGLINLVQELHLAPGSRLNHVVARRGAESAVIQRTQARVEAGADYRFAVLDRGGRLHRHDVMVQLLAEEARGEIDGVALIDSQQHVDFHTTIEHAVGPTNSRETFRMLADGSGVGVFNGRIHIHRGADDSHSDLNTANLLLSDSARINTKPELEIYAEEVTASHGATIGQLEDDALFYLRSRGIPASEAASLLKLGFATEPLSHIEPEALRGWLLSELNTTLANE
jgi:Fe-S cluster assembly protein SufD